MSTILKALRRLEHEKSAQIERPLREQVANSPEPKRGVSMTVAVAGIFATGLALGAAALIFWPRTAVEEIVGQDPVAVAPTPSPSAARERPIAAGPPAPIAKPELPNQAFQSPVAVVEREAPPADDHTVIELTAAPARTDGPPEGIRPAAEAMKPRPRFRPPAAPKPKAQPRKSPVAQMAAKEKSLAESTTGSPLPEGVRVASANRPAPPLPEEPASPALVDDPPVTTAPPPKADSVVAAAQVPAAAGSGKPELPEITPRLSGSTPPPTAPEEKSQSGTPKVSISSSDPAPPVESVQVARTLWHPRPEKRVAIVEVDGRPGSLELHEGDLVGTLVVGTIQPSGVVFLRDGVEVRQPVGTGR